MVKVARYGKREEQAATEWAQERRNRPTALVGVAVDEETLKVALRFRGGMELHVPISAIDEIARAPLAALRNGFADDLGEGLIFDDADAAIYVPGLIRDLFAPAFAGAMGKRGGRARTPAKTAAARKNGKKGGRPKRNAA